MLKLEKILDDAWSDVMDEFNHPPLDHPRIDYSVDTAAITMVDHKISINRNFVEELYAKGLDENAAVKSLLMHEVNHYMHCPFELRKYFQMLDMMQKRVAQPQDVCNYYMDVIINLDLLGGKDTHIAEIYRVLEKDSDILRLTVGLYEKYAGRELGADIGPGNKLKPYLDRLMTIDYSDEARWIENAGRFAFIVKDIADKEKDSKNPLGKITGKSYSASEQKKVLKELAESLDPKKFRRHVRNEKLRTANARASIEYYDILSKRFPITIVPKGGKTNGLQEHTKWSIDDPVSGIDIFNSYGKIFPGITQSWRTSPSISPGKDPPDLFLAIDSSGSMTAPHEEKSLAVLSAFCLANNYLANNRLVATYNFSHITRYTDFSSKRRLFDNLTHYTGGFTESFNPIIVAGKIGGRYCDIAICSDMDMANIDDVMKYLSEIRNVNRITMLCIDDRGIYSSLGRDIISPEMNYHIIRTEDDIRKIVIGAMSHYA